MGLVKRVLSKIDHLVIDLVRRFLVNSVLHTSRDIRLFIAVHKDLTLFLHHVSLFLRHSAPQKVAPPQCVSRKITHNLHNLFLIYNTPVSRLKNRFKLRTIVCDGRSVVLSPDILRNKVHGSRTVQRDTCDDILKAVGFKLLHEAFHSRAFQLENAVRLSGSDIIQNLRIIIINLFHIDVWIFLPCHSDSVLYYRQGTQA